MRIPIQLLGQSGCKFIFKDLVFYLDPYLSNSVQEIDADDLVRLLPIPILPEEINDADWILITHNHIDHCDPHTLPVIANASPLARFICPEPVVETLISFGIGLERIRVAEEDWISISASLKLRAIPAAHPELIRNEEGFLSYVGYLFNYEDHLIYHSGDTSVHQDIIDVLKKEGPIQTAFLPVNEHNFFRKRRGIIGNMSIREAFLFASEVDVKQLIPIHWDMFAVNSVSVNELIEVYKQKNWPFTLKVNPTAINLSKIHISIIIRTLNEEKYLDELLTSISKQKLSDLNYEVILVDSGSTDRTLQISQRHGCIISHIRREDFSFGRSLNVGCENSLGDILVFISGHCVPLDENWLKSLCEPLLNGSAQYSYGRQVGGDDSQFSETRIFNKYYPPNLSLIQSDFFCNNANSAILQAVWSKYKFNEELTGLEDMDLAKRLVQDGGKVKYIPEAGVYHYHNETWRQVRRRFEREAIALQKIMPQVHMSLFDVLRYIISSITKDWIQAYQERVLRRWFIDIVQYRWNQYIGGYEGNRRHRYLSRYEKEQFFYPE